jgi:hypothetical protein
VGHAVQRGVGSKIQRAAEIRPLGRWWWSRGSIRARPNNHVTSRPIDPGISCRSFRFQPDCESITAVVRLTYTAMKKLCGPLS